MNLINCHNHSLHSFDSKFSVWDMCSAAKQEGLYAFAITDHCEANEYDKHNLAITAKKSIAEITALKSQFGKFKLLAGIELGQALQDEYHAEQLLSIKGIDMVICSLHNVNNEVDYYCIDYKDKSNEWLASLTKRYYAEMLRMAHLVDFDVMGHITYPFRYLHNAKLTYNTIVTSIDPYDDIIREILRITISRGKGIEVNTSGLDKPIGDTMPSMKYLDYYRELGGEIISVGSDAHTPGRVGFGIKEAHELVKNRGFNYVTYFENRKPVMVKL